MKTIIPIVIVIILLAAGVFAVKSARKSAVTLPVLTQNTQVGKSNSVADSPVSNQPDNQAAGIALTITEPLDKSTVNSSSIIIKGKTSPYADIFVNDSELKAGSDGNFSTNLTLDEGENTIDIAANDDEGNNAEKELTVTYQP